MSYGNDTHTDAQRRVLAVVDAHGSSAIAFRTWPAMNWVHAGAARSLVARGALVEFAGPDGPMVRRRNAKTDLFYVGTRKHGASTMHVNLDPQTKGFADDAAAILRTFDEIYAEVAVLPKDAVDRLIESGRVPVSKS